MSKYLVILSTLFIIGCNITPRNEYIEGTSLTLGIYIPYNGQIYGIKAINFLSGKRITSYTNQFPQVKSEHIITNGSWGVDYTDITKTEIR